MTKVVLASGQSNAIGFLSGGTFKVSSSVQVWDTTAGKFVPADFENDTYDLTMGTPADTIGGGNNNFPLAFCHRIHEEEQEDVFLILNAKGGSAIDNWDTGDFTDDLIAMVNAALASSPLLTEIDYFLWCQGERDLRDGTSYNSYSESFESMITQLDNQLWYKKEHVKTCVVPMTQAFINNHLITKLDTQNFLLGLGSSDRERFGKTCVANPANAELGDINHYTGESLWNIGYYYVYSALERIEDENSTFGGAPIPQNVVVTTSATAGTGSITLDGAKNSLNFTRDGYAVYAQGKVVVSEVSSPSGDLRLTGNGYPRALLLDDSEIAYSGAWLENLSSAAVGDVCVIPDSNGDFLIREGANQTGLLTTNLASKVQAGTTIAINIRYIAVPEVT